MVYRPHSRFIGSHTDFVQKWMETYMVEHPNASRFICCDENLKKLITFLLKKYQMV